MKLGGNNKPSCDLPHLDIRYNSLSTFLNTPSLHLYLGFCIFVS